MINLRAAAGAVYTRLRSGLNNSAFWSAHNVTGHRRFATRQESLDFCRWRNAQCLFRERYMPLDAYGGKDVLDFGCGPGNTRDEFLRLCDGAGVPARVLGVGATAAELRSLPRRMQAIGDRRLPAEHRDFLRALTFDAHGLPHFDGAVAGIAGFYAFDGAGRRDAGGLEGDL